MPTRKRRNGRDAFFVGDEHRTNPLHQIPTDIVVCVRLRNGQILNYDNIHDPHAYLAAAKRNNPNLVCWWYEDKPDQKFKL